MLSRGPFHFAACKHIPPAHKALYKHLKDHDKSRGKKAHWIQSAHAMGFRNVDEDRNGIEWVGTTTTTSRTAKKVTLDLTTTSDDIPQHEE